MRFQTCDCDIRPGQIISANPSHVVHAERFPLAMRRLGSFLTGDQIGGGGSRSGVAGCHIIWRTLGGAQLYTDISLIPSRMKRVRFPLRVPQNWGRGVAPSYISTPTPLSPGTQTIIFDIRAPGPDLPGHPAPPSPGTLVPLSPCSRGGWAIYKAAQAASQDASQDASREAVSAHRK